MKVKRLIYLLSIFTIVFSFNMLPVSAATLSSPINTNDNKQDFVQTIMENGKLIEANENVSCEFSLNLSIGH